MAMDLLQKTRDREFAVLLERVELITNSDTRPPAPGTQVTDPARHLVSLGEYHPDDPALHPIPHEIAVTELRTALDDPTADPNGHLERTLTIQTLREFAARLLIARRRGELTADDTYARAVSDLAVALSFHSGGLDAPL
jgi:hypothetical protein